MDRVDLLHSEPRGEVAAGGLLELVDPQSSDQSLEASWTPVGCAGRRSSDAIDWVN